MTQVSSTAPSTFLGMPVARFDKALEIAISIILSCASLLTAWNGFQASQWGAVQGRNNNQAMALRVKATQSTALGTQHQQVDLSTYIAWLQAYSANDPTLATFIRERFRPEFKLAFEAWLATEPLKNPSAAPTPFAMKEYVVPGFVQAAAYEEEAAEASIRAQEAAEIARNYVITTLFVAAALFFAGIARTFNIRGVRVVVVVLSVLLLLVGLVNAAGLPKV
jgi:hypothetical protein